MPNSLTAIAAILLLTGGTAAANAETVRARLSMATPDGPGAAIGNVTFTDSPNGAIVTVALRSLAPGNHGFHIHDKGSCAPGADKTGKVIPAGAAGGHYDPTMAGKHAGPDGAGHQGDLPLVTADASGAVTTKLTAPHIMSVRALAGHALMVHVGGDNYSDDPAPLGGGGARLACGVIS